MNGLTISLLGPVRIALDGQPLAHLVGAKPLALLGYLAVEGRSPRGRLAALFWDEGDEAQARANLRLALTRLRKLLPGWIGADAQSVGLDPAAPLECDVLALHEAAAQAATLAPADALARAALHRGEFMAGLDLRGAEAFQHWLAGERARARAAALRLAGAAAQGWQRSGDTERAIEAARRSLALDETDESCHCNLMQWLAATGRRTAAIAQYEVLRQVLLDRLGARPSAASYELYRRIHADAPVAGAAGANSGDAVPATLAAPAASVVFGPHAAGADAGVERFEPTSRLAATACEAAAATPPAAFASAAGARGSVDAAPQPPWPDAALLPLLGRDRELALIDERLRDPECRVLTLLGPGGIGKTRLALAAAQAAAPRYADGAWFASLGPLDAEPRAACDDDPLLAALAEQLSGRQPGGVSSRDSLLRHFAARQCLLLLDNLEVAAPASARLIADLLHAAPRCKVLATSRIRLGAAREWLLDVAGLAWSGAAPLETPAAQLFCRHARRLHAGFDAAHEGAGIARLCAAVEGHPLALELAARHVRSLDCAAIAAQLGAAAPGEAAASASGSNGAGDRVATDADARAAGTTAAERRHASIARVIADSWALLAPEARAACRDLALFQDRFDAAAAQAVCGVGLPLLQVLIDHSWLRRDADGRFGFHPLQRDLAASQLAAAPERRASLAQAHLAHYAARLPAPDAPPGLADALLVHEGGHLRQALREACRRAEPQVLVPFVEAHAAALERQGLYQQALECFDEALAVPGMPPGWRSLWWLRGCEAHFNLGRSLPLKARFEAALEAAGLPQGAGVAAGWRRGQAARTFSRDAAAFAPLAPVGARWRAAFARALLYVGQAAYFAGEPAEAAASGVANIGMLGDGDALDLRARLWSVMAVSAGTIPLHALARAALRRARRLAPSPEQGRDAPAAWHVMLIYDYARARWDGTAETLQRCAELSHAQAQHRAAHEARSLCAKVHFMRGDFAAAQAVNLQLQDEARAGGFAMSEHWGLIGAAEAALHTGTPELAAVRGWTERAAALMHDIEITDPAYVIRAHGLAARIAWLQGDEAPARAAALRGLRAMQRVPYGIVYMLEGIAGVIETLQAIRARERAEGVPSREIEQACVAALRRLRAMARQFSTFVPRLRLYSGQEALAQGSARRARLWWQAAHRRALRLDMPYEAARAAAALGGLAALPDAQRARWQALACGLYARCGAGHELAELGAPEVSATARATLALPIRRTPR